MSSPPTHNPVETPIGENPYLYLLNGETWYWDFTKHSWYLPEQDPILLLQQQTEEEEQYISKLAEQAYFETHNQRVSENSNIFIDSDDDLYETSSGIRIPKKRPIEVTTEKNKKRKYEKVNTSVYFTGVPDDVTKDELEAFFSKAGIIKKDPNTGENLIRLFKTEDGKLKGDGVCQYLRQESIEQAIQLLDGNQLRYAVPINVTEATFTQKKKKKNKKKRKGDNKGDNNNSNTTTVDNSNNNEKNAETTGNFKSATKKKRIKFDQSKDLSWDEETRVHIILKHMFDPSEGYTDTEFVSTLKDEIRQECERFGKVESISVFEFNPEGVVAIKFVDPIAAGMCLDKMNGRFFGGKRIVAEYYDGYTNYYVKESEEQQKARAEAWAKWLENNE